MVKMWILTASCCNRGSLLFWEHATQGSQGDADYMSPSKPSARPIPYRSGKSEEIFFTSGLFLLVGAKLIFTESKKNYPM